MRPPSQSFQKFLHSVFLSFKVADWQRERKLVNEIGRPFYSIQGYELQNSKDSMWSIEQVVAPNVGDGTGG
jgi:hypothetical protein